MKLVLSCGCFDLLHLGHIRHLEAAAKLGDKLFVCITPDEFISKGPGRPAFNQQQRVEAINALACVDFAFIGRGPTAVEAIMVLRPAIYVKGPDCRDHTTPGLEAECKAAYEIGCEVVYTTDSVFSSTTLLHRAVVNHG
jgi:cytidyltransferase-like protein